MQGYNSKTYTTPIFTELSSSTGQKQTNRKLQYNFVRTIIGKVQGAMGTQMISNLG